MQRVAARVETEELQMVIFVDVGVVDIRQKIDRAEVARQPDMGEVYVGSRDNRPIQQGGCRRQGKPVVPRLGLGERDELIERSATVRSPIKS